MGGLGCEGLGCGSLSCGSLSCVLVPNKKQKLGVIFINMADKVRHRNIKYAKCYNRLRFPTTFKEWEKICGGY